MSGAVAERGSVGPTRHGDPMGRQWSRSTWGDPNGCPEEHVMKKARALPVGTYVRIPLEDGSFGYGRVLSNPYMGFYNHRTAEPTDDLDAIDARPVLFTQAVRLLRFDRWVKLGCRELDGEMARPVVRFMQDLADFRRCVLFDSTGAERQVGPEACVGVERAEVWELRHIERRLLDTFMGRPNPDEVHARVRLA
ncbi:MAG: Imm26 family immunity protein [Polyangiales bacterium]